MQDALSKPVEGLPLIHSYHLSSQIMRLDSGASLRVCQTDAAESVEAMVRLASPLAPQLFEKTGAEAAQMLEHGGHHTNGKAQGGSQKARLRPSVRCSITAHMQPLTHMLRTPRDGHAG